MMKEKNSRETVLMRGAFWTSIVFYGLIALEFFYMVSPFAAYIYNVPSARDREFSVPVSPSF